MTNPITVVTWIDSSLQNGQVDHSELPEPSMIRSVGWLIADTPEQMTLARDDMGDGDLRGLIAIPRCAVLALTTEGVQPDPQKTLRRDSRESR